MTDISFLHHPSGVYVAVEISRGRSAMFRMTSWLTGINNHRFSRDFSNVRNRAMILHLLCRTCKNFTVRGIHFAHTAIALHSCFRSVQSWRNIFFIFFVTHIVLDITKFCSINTHRESLNNYNIFSKLSHMLMHNTMIKFYIIIETHLDKQFYTFSQIYLSMFVLNEECF